MAHISHIDHIAIAVESIDEAKNFYENALGLKISSIEEMPKRGIRVAFIRLGETTIELMEPLNPQSEISAFLAKRGAGIHHLALNTKEIGDSEAQLRKNGVRLVYSQCQSGAHDTLVNFVHPSSTGGALIELVQDCHKPHKSS